jgi:hypothetical protein
LIFYSHKCGQLGNRLFAFAHLISYCASYNHRIVNLAFEEYAPYFLTTSQDVLCRYPFSRSVIRAGILRQVLYTLNRVILKVLRVINFRRSSFHEVIVADLPEYEFNTGEFLHMDSNLYFQQVLNRKPVVFLFGRFFRDFKNFRANQELIRNYFKPTEDIQQNVHRLLTKAREGVELLVGVHIRRGDYSHYANGKYYFSQASYLEKMNELMTNSESRKIRFLICSNEQIDTEVFAKQNFIIGSGNLVEDMYSLAGCDFIIGPPSSFTRWASFYGNVPLFLMDSLTKEIRLDSFVILDDIYLLDF